MLDSFTHFTPALFAQTAAQTTTGSNAGGDPLSMIFFMLPLILVFYWFFILRPQQKQEDKNRKMLEALDRNDRVYTVGGMVGTIYSIDREKNEVVLKVDDSNNTKIRFLLSAIAAPLPKDQAKES